VTKKTPPERGLDDTQESYLLAPLVAAAGALAAPHLGWEAEGVQNRVRTHSPLRGFMRGVPSRPTTYALVVTPDCCACETDGANIKAVVANRTALVIVFI
jgi:hypothetical protein